MANKREWRIDNTLGCWIKNDKGKAICAICASLSTPEYKANANLIAASPRMLEFIQKLANSGNKEAKDFIQTLDL